MSGTPSPIQVGGLVPNVWFDLFGRIIPAAYLLLGILGTTWNSQPTVCLFQYLEDHPVTGLPIVFLLFVGATYMVGWLLGTASYWIVEYPADKIREYWPYKEESSIIPEGIAKIIGEHCGSKWSENLSEENKKQKAKDHCSYLIWHTDPSLAVIFGRWDAESLGARSSLLVSAVLLIFAYRTRQAGTVFVVLLIVAVLSVEAYRYHSKRALNARFDMVLALFGPQLMSANPPVAPPSSD